MPTATISPIEFVFELMDLRVPGSPPDNSVALSQYLCAAGEWGGNKKASELRRMIREVGKIRNLELLKSTFKIDAFEYERIWTGQGKPDHIATVMKFIVDYGDDLKKIKNTINFIDYYKAISPLQAMVHDKLFGLDCIGYVGRYLERSGMLTAYPGIYPRQYLDIFDPVRSIAEIEGLCIVVWANGAHIAIIDQVEKPTDDRGRLFATICQSSSGGPQLNTQVEFTQGGGDVLDIAAYNKAAAQLEKQARQEKWSAPQLEAEKAQKRKDLVLRGTTTGYKGGQLFKLQGGLPASPAQGIVYVAKMKDLKTAW